MVALSITILIGSCIAMMISGMAMGTTGQQDGRRHLVRMQTLETRLIATVHSSQCILASGNGYLVYWVADRNCDNILQLSELGLLELDNTGTLQQYATVFPANFSLAQIASADTGYPANTNWYAAAQTAKSSGYFVATPLAHDVSTFTVTLDNAAPTAARLVTMSVQLDDGQVQRAGAVTAAVRSLQAPQ
jgi:hypothetical protein